MSFTITVTNAGRAAIVNAAKDGTNAVRIASVGVSATATTPTAATNALPGEIKRITTIAGDAVAADTIHVTVRDETNAQYAVRSIALYLSDGTLFAAYGQSDVLVEKSAQAMLLLALDVRFADIAATNITFGSADFLNPPATTETAGVAELATDAETSAGTDDRRTITPKGLSFALTARFAAWGSDIWRQQRRRRLGPRRRSARWAPGRLLRRCHRPPGLHARQQGGAGLRRSDQRPNPQ
jgi:hypothetical protein